MLKQKAMIPISTDRIIVWRERHASHKKLLTGPDNTRHPHYVASRQRMILRRWTDRPELDGLGGAALELLEDHGAVLGLDDYSVALAERRRRRDEYHASVTIDGF